MLFNKLILASGNQHKIIEIQNKLNPLNISLISQKELGVNDIPETGLTFIENALIKARHASETTGLPALADDSGLCVDSLDGQPGLYSARYAGENADDKLNREKLLLELDEYKNTSQRKAYFICVLVLLRNPLDPDPIISIGQWHGEIGFEDQGDMGFGYDPIFIIPELNCTAAELELNKKNQISHRGIALERLVKNLGMLS